MYVIVDDPEGMADGCSGGLVREGIACVRFSAVEFGDWLQSASDTDLSAAEAFLLGDCDMRATLPRAIRRRCPAPIIALSGHNILENTLELFDAGVDDVVHGPVHHREVLARTAAIVRRGCGASVQTGETSIQVFADGRDPIVGGSALPLPRRELRILEYMVGHQGKWLTKTKIFDAVYGIFESKFDENVIESHISRLRRKLRDRLGYDPIVSRRYVGYRLDTSVRDPMTDAMPDLSRLGVLCKRAPSRPDPALA